MRIGIFTDSYLPYINGVSTSVLMLKEALEKQGHEVFIVTVNPNKMKYEYEGDKIIRIPGIPVGIYDYRLTSIYPIRVINKIRKWKLDVIHSQTEFGVGTFARVIASQFRIPIVHTYHTYYEDYMYYITKGHFDKAGKRFVRELANFYCDKSIDELIVPTKKIYDVYKDKYKFKRDINIVPTGLDIERFYKEKFDIKEVNKLKKEYNIKKDDISLLFVGRIAKEKNIDLLINNMIKDDKLKLIIIGDGPDMAFYKNMVKEKNLEDRIIFVGKIPYKEIPIYYQLANIFVTASRSETQGLTVIEALASSLPVLAIQDDSFKDVVIDNENGFIFNDEKEYKKILTKLLKNKDLINKLSEGARKSSNNYSSDTFASNVLKVYEKAIEKRKNKTLLTRLKEQFDK